MAQETCWFNCTTLPAFSNCKFTNRTRAAVCTKCYPGKQICPFNPRCSGPSSDSPLGPYVRPAIVSPKPCGFALNQSVAAGQPCDDAVPARRKNNDPPVSGAANSSQPTAVPSVALLRLRVMFSRRDIPGKFFCSPQCSGTSCPALPANGSGLPRPVPPPYSPTNPEPQLCGKAPPCGVNFPWPCASGKVPPSVCQKWEVKAGCIIEDKGALLVSVLQSL